LYKNKQLRFYIAISIETSPLNQWQLYCNIFSFIDIYCELRPKYARREPPTNTTSGPMSPSVSARLEYVSICKDGSVGMPVYITVMHILKIKEFPFDAIDYSYQWENELFINIDVVYLHQMHVTSFITNFVIWQKLSNTVFVFGSDAFHLKQKSINKYILSYKYMFGYPTDDLFWREHTIDYSDVLLKCKSMEIRSILKVFFKIIVLD